MRRRTTLLKKKTKKRQLARTNPNVQRDSHFSKRALSQIGQGALVQERWLCEPMEKKTDHSNCHFAVQRASDGKPVLVVQLYQDSIPALNGTTLGLIYWEVSVWSRQRNLPRC